MKHTCPNFCEQNWDFIMNFTKNLIMKLCFYVFTGASSCENHGRPQHNHESPQIWGRRGASGILSRGVVRFLTLIQWQAAGQLAGRGSEAGQPCTRTRSIDLPYHDYRLPESHLIGRAGSGTVTLWACQPEGRGLGVPGPLRAWCAQSRKAHNGRPAKGKPG